MENLTEPLGPAGDRPLLVWAMSMVDDFADDILAAWQARQHLVEKADASESSPAGLAAVRALLLPLIESGQPVPARRHGDSLRLAHQYIAAITGASISQVERFAAKHLLMDLPADRQAPAPWAARSTASWMVGRGASTLTSTRPLA